MAKYERFDSSMANNTPVLELHSQNESYYVPLTSLSALHVVTSLTPPPPFARGIYNLLSPPVDSGGDGPAALHPPPLLSPLPPLPTQPQASGEAMSACR